MTTRILPVAEWDRLRASLDLDTWRQVDPTTIQIVVVEDHGEVIAHWATMACRHVEGFWVHPDHRRRGGALRRLFVGMREILNSLNATTVLTQAETDELKGLLDKAGATRMRGQSYFLPVDSGPWSVRGPSCP